MDSQKVGIFIKQLRIEKNMTQDELAEKINVTNKAVSRWERGIGFPDISLLEPLSKELGISILELLNGELIAKKNVKEKSNDINILIDYFLEIREIYDFKKIIFTTLLFLFLSLFIFLTYFNLRFHGFDITDSKIFWDRINVVPFLNIYSTIVTNNTLMFIKNIIMNSFISLLVSLYIKQFILNKKRYIKSIVIINIVLEIFKLFTFIGLFDINDILIRILVGMSIFCIHKKERRSGFMEKMRL